MIYKDWMRLDIQHLYNDTRSIYILIDSDETVTVTWERLEAKNNVTRMPDFFLGFPCYRLLFIVIVYCPFIICFGLLSR